MKSSRFATRPSLTFALSLALTAGPAAQACDIVAVDAGGRHTLAVQDGASRQAVFAWGLNRLDQLGCEARPYSVDQTSVPVPVSQRHGILGAQLDTRGSSVLDLSAGIKNSLVVAGSPAFTDSFRLLAFGWGIDGNGQLGTSYGNTKAEPWQCSVWDLIGVSMGNLHSLFLLEDGTVASSGESLRGEGGCREQTYVPLPVDGLADIVSVAAGRHHSIALDSSGVAFAFGEGAAGQLGDGTTSDRCSPATVPGLPRIVAIDAGHDHNLALAGDGTVWAWGRGDAGQLGDGTFSDALTPRQVISLGSIVGISAGFAHSLAVDASGGVWAWGRNDDGELGDGTVQSSSVPVGVVGLADVVSVSAGGAPEYLSQAETGHSVALRDDGTVWAWGGNGDGQLGDGTTLASSVPVQTVFEAPAPPIDTVYAVRHSSSVRIHAPPSLAAHLHLYADTSKERTGSTRKLRDTSFIGWTGSGYGYTIYDSRAIDDADDYYYQVRGESACDRVPGP